MKHGRRMRKTLAALAVTTLLMGFGGFSASADIIGTKIVLRALDKVTATTKDYTVVIGETLHYGSLEITAHHCQKRPPEEIPETYGFLQILDGRLDGKGGEGEKQKLFSGWMFASSPALSALDHPVYDIWVIDCIGKAPAEAVTAEE